MSNPESHGVEDYLEAIYELQEEGERVVQARISRRLGVTRASVSEQVARLQKMRLVESNARAITLTTHGFAVAEDAVRKHRLAERFLTDVLKMPWHLAHQEANRFQSGITAEIEGRMLSVLGEPATCPHGNPIPGSKHAANGAPTVRLSDASPGDVTVVRVSERLEMNDEGLRVVVDARLVPQSEATVIEHRDGGVLVKTVSGEHLVPARVADQLYVSAG